jgi:hypothetical protein
MLLLDVIPDFIQRHTAKVGLKRITHVGDRRLHFGQGKIASELPLAVTAEKSLATVICTI